MDAACQAGALNYQATGNFEAIPFMNENTDPERSRRFSHVELLVCRRLYPHFLTMKQALPHRSMIAIKSSVINWA
jgi:hypothetical protein